MLKTFFIFSADEPPTTPTHIHQKSPEKTKVDVKPEETKVKPDEGPKVVDVKIKEPENKIQKIKTEDFKYEQPKTEVKVKEIKSEMKTEELKSEIKSEEIKSDQPQNKQENVKIEIPESGVPKPDAPKESISNDNQIAQEANNKTEASSEVTTRDVQSEIAKIRAISEQQEEAINFLQDLKSQILNEQQKISQESEKQEKLSQQIQQQHELLDQLEKHIQLQELMEDQIEQMTCQDIDNLITLQTNQGLIQLEVDQSTQLQAEQDMSEIQSSATQLIEPQSTQSQSSAPQSSAPQSYELQKEAQESFDLQTQIEAAEDQIKFLAAQLQTAPSQAPEQQ